jgi:3-O-methylgallate 3,4-dioxygenase
MARIILGIASSHSPQVSTPADQWHFHVDRDRESPYLDFESLMAASTHDIDDQLAIERMREKDRACQVAIGELARTLEEAAPDVVIVIGDDQRELFFDDGTPAFGIFYGDSIVDTSPDKSTMHPSIQLAYWSQHSDTPEAYPVDGRLATHLISRLVADAFDITAYATQPAGRTLGHAFTFVRRRLMSGVTRPIPIVPLFVNCFYPPNQPTAARCYELGRALRRAVMSYDADVRVAIIATGGLSHFVVDEAFDRSVLTALADRDVTALKAIPQELLVSGTSEIRNWLVLAGAVATCCESEIVDYVPAYRSSAKTGCGMGFMRWGEATVPAIRSASDRGALATAASKHTHLA